MHPDSPEDRLLHLIRGEKGKQGTPAAAGIASTEKFNIPAEVKSGFLSSLMIKICVENVFFKPSSLKRINKYLALILLLLLAYLGFLFYPSSSDDVNSLINSDIQLVVRAKPGEIKNNDFSYYLKDIKGKNIFQAPQIKKTIAIEEETIDINKRFNLVGVLPWDNPQAVIEDLEAGKTLYVVKGQQISNVLVTEITEEHVVLNYNDTDYKLVL